MTLLVIGYPALTVGHLNNQWINESTEKPLVEAIDGKKIYNYMYTLHFVDWGEGYRNSLEENIYAIRYNWQAGKKKEKKKMKEGI